MKTISQGAARLGTLVGATCLALGIQAIGAAAQVPPAESALPTAIADIHATAARSATAAITQRFSPISNAFKLPNAPSRAPKAAGLAGGDALRGWSGWGSLSFGQSNTTFVPAQRDGRSQTLSLGLDRPVSNGTTAGVAFTYFDDDSNTVFNGGTVKTRSVSIAPYVNLTLKDWLTADFSLGISAGNTSQMRRGPVYGKYSSRTMFGSAGLNASKWHGLWLSAGRGGLTASSTNQSAFTETDKTFNPASSSHLVQASLGGTVGYYANPALIYMKAEYRYDISKTLSTVPGAANDRDAFYLTLGVDFYGKDKWANLSGGAGITKEIGRTQMNTTSAVVNVRYAF